VSAPPQRFCVVRFTSSLGTGDRCFCCKLSVLIFVLLSRFRVLRWSPADRAGLWFGSSVLEFVKQISFLILRGSLQVETDRIKGLSFFSLPLYFHGGFVSTSASCSVKYS
jgi:hypothetical protein